MLTIPRSSLLGPIPGDGHAHARPYWRRNLSLLHTQAPAHIGQDAQRVPGVRKGGETEGGAGEGEALRTQADGQHRALEPGGGQEILAEVLRCPARRCGGDAGLTRSCKRKDGGFGFGLELKNCRLLLLYQHSRSILSQASNTCIKLTYCAMKLLKSLFQIHPFWRSLINNPGALMNCFNAFIFY